MSQDSCLCEGNEERMCETEFDLSPVPKDLRSFPGAVRLSKVCVMCLSAASMRRCCCKLHLCMGGALDYVLTSQVML